jgi:branched-subunit amino acid aminotransferase/4-amino-4-deoxychorismate lyase
MCGSQGGDAVWEGLRVYGGRVFHLDKHLRRLRDSARAMDFKGTRAAYCLKSSITDVV